MSRWWVNSNERQGLYELGREGSGENEARSAQYALAGAYIVKKSDALVAVVNSASGTESSELPVGGTRHVVQMWEHGVPPEYDSLDTGLFAAKTPHPHRKAREIDIKSMDSSE